MLEQGKFVAELRGSILEKIDSSPQGKTSTNSSVDRGAPSSGQSTTRGVESVDLSESDAKRALHSTKFDIKSTTRGYEYAMCGHPEACADKYLELAE